jgi:hypothetical protein
MIHAVDGTGVVEAIARLHAAAGLPWPPPLGDAIAPVSLDRLIATYNLVHEEVPALSRAVAGAYLARWGIHRPELLEDASPLAGFLFANAGGGYILVRADDPLPRRRFTAAHELGHYLLHFLRRLDAERDGATQIVQDDGADTVCEDEELSLPEMERQANQFAAELLMPESLCRTSCERLTNGQRTTSAFLEHRLSSELLVSRQAVRWRLRSLNLTN